MLGFYSPGKTGPALSMSTGTGAASAAFALWLRLRESNNDLHMRPIEQFKADRADGHLTALGVDDFTHNARTVL